METKIRAVPRGPCSSAEVFYFAYELTLCVLPQQFMIMLTALLTLLLLFLYFFGIFISSIFCIRFCHLWLMSVCITPVLYTCSTINERTYYCISAPLFYFYSLQTIGFFLGGGVTSSSVKSFNIYSANSNYPSIFLCVQKCSVNFQSLCCHDHHMFVFLSGLV